MNKQTPSTAALLLLRVYFRALLRSPGGTESFNKLFSTTSQYLHIISNSSKAGTLATLRQRLSAAEPVNYGRFLVYGVGAGASRVTRAGGRDG